MGFATASAILATLILLGVNACIGARFPGRYPGSFRLTSVAEEGDAARRASMRLVLEGLQADADAQPRMASDLYGRALQVDPTNPWAYLALARHRVVEGVAPDEALSVLDQAEALLRLENGLTPPVEAHLVGLRGAALLATGRSAEGLSRLDRARELAPTVWSDGRLDAWELR